MENGDFEVSKRFWAFAAYSRYIRPGAWRVDVSSGGDKGLRTTAFVNADGSVVVVAINNNTTPAQLSLAGVKTKSAKAYLTDTTHDMAITPVTVGADGIVGDIVLPARAMLTVVILQ